MAASSSNLVVLAGVMRGQARGLILWALALGAVSAMYISFYPSFGDDQMDQMIADMPEDLVIALGYDRIGSAAGWVTTTVYGLVAPILLLVFAVAGGSRLIAGAEEEGTLELELTSAVVRRQVLGERILALWLSVLALVVVIALVSYGLVQALDMDVGISGILAGTLGLYLLVTGLGTVALAAGAITGRRAIALGAGAGLAVLAFVFDALGPVVEAGWMTAISPFSWYLENDPLATGFDVRGLILLAIVPIVFAAAGLLAFDRRDLMV
jgi:ABC-2 type transport system permease protein